MGNADQENPDLNEALEEGQEQLDQPEADPSVAAHDRQAELVGGIREDAERQKRRERAALAREAEGGVDLDVDTDTDGGTDTDTDLDSPKKKEKPKKPGFFAQLRTLFSMGKGSGWDEEVGIWKNREKINWGGVWKAATAGLALAGKNVWEGIKTAPGKIWDAITGLWKKDKKKKSSSEAALEVPLLPAISFKRWEGLIDIPEGLRLNIKEDTAVFLDVLGKQAKLLGKETPYITSAFRDHKDQARAMAGKWQRAVDGANGDKAAGLKNFKAVYSDSTAEKFHAIFKKYGVGEEGQKRAAVASAETWPNPSGHRAGASLDLRMTDGIKEILDAVAKTGTVQFKRLNEGDHYHITVTGSSPEKMLVA